MSPPKGTQVTFMRESRSHREGLKRTLQGGPRDPCGGAPGGEQCGSAGRPQRGVPRSPKKELQAAPTRGLRDPA
eukprot:6963836-Pyramimonas_sp.AAC.1